MSNDRRLISKSPQAVSSTKANILTKMGTLSSYLQNKYKNNLQGKKEQYQYNVWHLLGDIMEIC